MISHICTIDRVSVAYFDNGTLTTLGNGHIAVFLDDESNIIKLRCLDYFGIELAVIALEQWSNAWLQEEHLLVLDRKEGGRWRIDCSDSDPDVFAGFQDLLTYFIKYENRHHLHNALALMNPITCRVTKVVSRNVYLDETQAEAITASAKQPVVVDQDDLRGTSVSNETKKAQLLYQTSDAIISGSDWIAQSIANTGHSVARMISSRINENQSNTSTAVAIRLSETDKHYIDAFIQLNQALFRAIGGLFRRATTSTVTGINTLYDDTRLQADPETNAVRHFGVSLLHAIYNVFGGVAEAGGAILSTSRDTVVNAVHEKYGPGAAYLVDKAFGPSDEKVPDVLVYFDSQGVARQVFVGKPQTSTAFFQQGAATTSFTTESPDEADYQSANDKASSQYAESAYQSTERSFRVNTLDSKFIPNINKKAMPLASSSQRSVETSVDGVTTGDSNKDTCTIENLQYVRV